MGDTNDIRADLEMYGAMWDELEGLDPSVGEPKHSHTDQSNDEFGGLVSSKAQDFYHAYNDEELMQESKSQNPVYPDSVGADSENPSAAWVDENLLKEVETLKKKLFSVENKMAEMGGGKNWQKKALTSDGDKKLMTQIESIRKSIEKVSNKLGVKNEPSPWTIKKD